LLEAAAVVAAVVGAFVAPVVVVPLLTLAMVLFDTPVALAVEEETPVPAAAPARVVRPASTSRPRI